MSQYLLLSSYYLSCAAASASSYYQIHQVQIRVEEIELRHNNCYTYPKKHTTDYLDMSYKMIYINCASLMKKVSLDKILEMTMFLKLRGIWVSKHKFAKLF